MSHPWIKGGLEAPRSIDKLAEDNDLHQRQEVLVYFYLGNLVRQVEQIQESRIMPLIRERRIFMIGCKFLKNYFNSIPKESLLKAVECLSVLAESEDFSTYRNSYIPPENLEDIDNLVIFRTDVLSPLLSDLESRRVVRPLADAIDKAKRQYGRK